MTTEIDLAASAGRLAGRLGKPLTECPYDPDGEQAGLALAFVRGWQQARADGGDQTAAVTDKHGNVHSPADGKFVKKGAGGGAPASPRAVAELHEIARDRKSSAEAGQRAARILEQMDDAQLKRFAEGQDIEIRGLSSREKQIDAVLRDLVKPEHLPGADKPPTSSRLKDARTKLARGVTMHGSDRSKWSAKDKAAAARLDKVIAAGELQEAIDSGAPDALAGVDRPELMKAAKARGVKVPRGASAETIRGLLTGKPTAPEAAPAKSDGAAKVAAAVAGVKDVVDQYIASDPDDSGPSTERIRGLLSGMKAVELKQIRSDLAAQDMPIARNGRTKDEMVRDILRGTIGFRADSRAMRNIGVESPFGMPKPVTSKMNAHSFGRGQQFWERGNIYTVRLHREIARDGERFIEFEVTDTGGNVSTMVKKLNQPLDRVVGGTGGGSGTFAVEGLQELFRAQLVAAGVENPDDYTITYDITSLLDLDQIAAVGDYDRAHGITRAHNGRFGRGTRLGDLLQNIAGGNDDEDADNFQLASGSAFDWASKDHNGDRLLEITGRMDSDEDDEDDEDFEEPGPDSGLVRLHMSKKDMRRWASTMANGLLREQMLATGMDPDDPKTHLMVSMLETMDHSAVDFDDNIWDQTMSWYPDGDGGWSMHVTDEDGDAVTVKMTTPEFTALHAQVARQVIDDNDEPRREAMASRQQTAAAADLTEFAMPEQLEDYWLHGPGAARVRWCTRGAFRRARVALLAEGVPLESIGGTVRNLYVKACGHEPGRKKGLEMASEDPAYVALQQFPSQTACGCSDHEAPAELAAADEILAAPTVGAEVDLPAPEGAPSTSTGWRGPLAPVDIATGDKRKFAPGALGSRVLPLPFRWQERQERGHDGAVVVGALTGYGVLTEPEMFKGVLLPVGTIMGEGYFLDEGIIPDVSKAKHLAEHGVIGPSVDLEPTMQVTYVDKETGTAFNPNECGQDGTCPAHGEAVITDATIAGATMVPITAFADCRAPNLFTRTVNQDAEFAAASNQTAGAAHAVDWDEVPIAPAGTAWDPAGARVRLLTYARAEDLPVEEAETDWRAFSLGFLWADDRTGTGREFAGGRPDVESGYLFQIVDIIDGVPTIVPEAVFAAAARVDSAILGSMAKREIRELLEDLYGQMAEEFGMDEEEFHAPWERQHQMSSGASADCGCADKWAKLGSQTAAGQYGVFGDMAPYPADAFKPRKLDQLTPVTIEQRPGEAFARVFGHAASWKSCNRGYRGVCVPPPKNKSGYAQFHLGAVRTDEGLLSVGKIVQGEGHPDTGTGARIARAYYDRTSKTTALVRAQDDQFGIQLAGIIPPDVTPAEATMLLASPPSGDWKDGEMIAVLAVNVPGHVVPRATLIEGQPVNMVAAGRFWPEEDHAMFEGEAELLQLTFAALDDEVWAAETDTLMALLQGGGE